MSTKKEDKDEKNPVRSYGIAHHANQGKLDKIDDLFREYRKTAHLVANHQWNLFYRRGYFDRNSLYSYLDNKTNLSKRYIQTLQYQVVGILDSYLSNVRNEVKRRIYNSSLDEETKIILFTINKYNLYYRHNPQIKKQPIDPALIKLARRILKSVIDRWQQPSVNYINMNLDNKVAVISANNGNSSFDYWVKLSTLTPNHPTNIPLSSNAYFDDKKTKQKKFVQINKKDKNYEFRFLKEIETNTYVPNEGVNISMDVGLRYLLATKMGDLMGRGLIKYLMKYDKILNNLDAHNRKHKRKIKSQLHNKIVAKIKHHLKHLICLCLKKIINLYKPEELIFEDLNFQDANLSKTMNRILRNFGLGCLRNVASNISQATGIKITYVHAAYSSQTCSNPKCGYVSKNNRKGEKFECEMCGHRCHADVNGSRILDQRSSRLEYQALYRGCDDVLQIVVSDYLERNPYEASSSRAKALLDGNPYFHQATTKGSLVEFTPSG